MNGLRKALAAIAVALAAFLVVAPCAARAATSDIEATVTLANTYSWTGYSEEGKYSMRPVIKGPSELLISASAPSGIKSIQYEVTYFWYVDMDYVWEDEALLDDNWEMSPNPPAEYSDPIEITSDGTEQSYAVLFRVEDNAGNVKYVNTDVFTVDMEAPRLYVLNGGDSLDNGRPVYGNQLEAGLQYENSETFYVADCSDVTLTADGKSVAVDDGYFSLQGYSGETILVATDALGNETRMIVYLENTGANKTVSTKDDCRIETTVNSDGSKTVAYRYKNKGVVILEKDSTGRTTSRKVLGDHYLGDIYENFVNGDYTYNSDGSFTVGSDDDAVTIKDGTFTVNLTRTSLNLDYEEIEYSISKTYAYDETALCQKLQHYKAVSKADGSSETIVYVWDGDEFTYTLTDYDSNGVVTNERGYAGDISGQTASRTEQWRVAYVDGKPSYRTEGRVESTSANTLKSVLPVKILNYGTDGSTVSTTTFSTGDDSVIATVNSADGSVLKITLRTEGEDASGMPSAYVSAVEYSVGGKTVSKTYVKSDNAIMDSTKYDDENHVCTLSDGLVVALKRGVFDFGFGGAPYIVNVDVTIPQSYLETMAYDPRIISGAEAVYGGSGTLSFTSSDAFSGFKAVYVDGAVVDPSNYAAAEGSIKVTLSESYLKTLSAGEHSLAIESANGKAETTFTVAASTVAMHRMYNPSSGEHFYTASDAERNSLVKAGWKYEGTGWIAPSTSSTPVYRLYSGTDHHYTTSWAEVESLKKAGWKYEGIGWYSDDAKGVPLYRQFNPNVQPTAKCNNSGSHNYTTSLAENASLVKAGWREEGIAWYGVKQ